MRNSLKTQNGNYNNDNNHHNHRQSPSLSGQENVLHIRDSGKQKRSIIDDQSPSYRDQTVTNNRMRKLQATSDTTIPTAMSNSIKNGSLSGGADFCSDSINSGGELFSTNSTTNMTNATNAGNISLNNRNERIKSLKNGCESRMVQNNYNNLNNHTYDLRNNEYGYNVNKETEIANATKQLQSRSKLWKLNINSNTHNNHNTNHNQQILTQGQQFVNNEKISFGCSNNSNSGRTNVSVKPASSSATRNDCDNLQPQTSTVLSPNANHTPLGTSNNVNSVFEMS